MLSWSTSSPRTSEPAGISWSSSKVLWSVLAGASEVDVEYRKGQFILFDLFVLNLPFPELLCWALMREFRRPTFRTFCSAVPRLWWRFGAVDDNLKCVGTLFSSEFFMFLILKYWSATVFFVKPEPEANLKGPMCPLDLPGPTQQRQEMPQTLKICGFHQVHMIISTRRSQNFRKVQYSTLFNCRSEAANLLHIAPYTRQSDQSDSPRPVCTVSVSHEYPSR